MAVQLCPRCSRANPTEAQFCHFDGAELRTVPGSPYRGSELGREFVFPSGRRCRTYDDLIRGCSEEWSAARNMLKQGGLRQFLAGIGRMDLALAADRAAAQSDLDMALDQFLAQLPAREATGPHLELTPRRVVLGKLKPGELRQFQLAVSNQGVRILTGTIQVEKGEWISFGPGVPNQLQIKIGKQQHFPLYIDTFGLVSGQRYSTKVTVITNGGAAEVPVTMDLTPIPFPHPPLQGALSGRDLAGRMRESPKQAAPFLENGEVQRWFAANGWRYPVQGPTAKGIAAVQQFFEGMGVSKPPPLTLSDESVLMICREGKEVQGRVTVRTSARKWIYGHVESDAPWLQVPTADIGGAQQAVIEFAADARSLEPNRRYEGRLNIVANSRQKLSVGVILEVRPAPTDLGLTVTRALCVGALSALLLRLAASAADLPLRGPLAFGSWLELHDLESMQQFIRVFTLMTAWLGAPMGGLLLWQRSGVRDVPAGMVVGGVTGLAVCATLGCMVLVVDPLLQQILPVPAPGLAILLWTIAGMIVASPLALMGRFGRRLVKALAQPFAWALRSVGLQNMAEMLAGEE
jgi:hypothetical protein